MEFLAQGVHLKTTNATGYARAHFKVGIPLSQAPKVDYTWYGTDFQPSAYYDVDVDGDGKVDGQFIGELTPAPAILLKTDAATEPLPSGFTHF